MPVSLPSTSRPTKSMKTIKSQENVLAVDERSFNKSSLSRFKRNDTINESPSVSIANELNSNSTDICIELLSTGFVLSYIDFYNLIQTSSSKGSFNIMDNADDMIFVRDQLIQSEIYRRKGNTKGVFSSYISLASFFVKKCDWKTSIFFFEKSLEIAQLAMDIRAEMLANHELGCVYYNMANYEMSLKYHNRHVDLGYSVDLIEEVAKANTELYKVYVMKASNYEKSNDFDSALKYFQMSLECAKKCWDKSSEAEANGSIGNLMLLQGLAEESLPYLLQQSAITTDIGNTDGRCRASSSLAYAYDLLSNTEKAIVELRLVQTISEQDGDMLLQSKASKELGVLYSKLGKLQDAHDALLRHYQLLAVVMKSNHKMILEWNKDHSYDTNSSTIIPISELEIAKCLVGVSKGNLLIGSYVYNIENNWMDLLNWKLNRQSLINL